MLTLKMQGLTIAALKVRVKSSILSALFEKASLSLNWKGNCYYLNRDRGPLGGLCGFSEARKTV